MNGHKINTSRLLSVSVIVGIAVVLLLLRLFLITQNSEYYAQFDLSAPKSVKVVRSYGNILDRNGTPLNNRSEKYIAVINPETANRSVLDGLVIDREKYDSCIGGNALFLCEVSSAEIDGITVIPVKNRLEDDCFAEHIIGYQSEGKGVSGIELACGECLQREKSTVTLNYCADASGNLIEGSGLALKYSNACDGDVMLSIDAEIQTAAEAAMKDVKKGAAVVIDISAGDIVAVVSKPYYNQQDPAESLDSDDSPFVNRAFCAYSVGSVFKLVTAGAAIESGISDEFTYTCTGSITVRENEFGCHRFGGHGEIDMRTAMVESCNPYFICLGQNMGADRLHEFAERLGFGRAYSLCSGISSASGYLTTANELRVPEEKANFCFGQGKLTATPLQVTLMTAAIANDGNMPEPRLVIGEDISEDTAAEVYSSAEPRFTSVMKKSTADKLKSFMISTMYKENSAAVPEFTTGGGKTSTAQTWTYNEYGTENVNCWFTGFFPADKPKYAVTIMIEEGVSGNYTCGPVFKEIADSVSVRRYASVKKNGFVQYYANNR
ncbi:MAG: peptidoglycan D,D-transpeptidase FtsI family protein [Huintestinicola sp.]